MKDIINTAATTLLSYGRKIWRGLALLLQRRALRRLLAIQCFVFGVSLAWALWFPGGLQTPWATTGLFDPAPPTFPVQSDDTKREQFGNYFSWAPSIHFVNNAIRCVDVETSYALMRAARFLRGNEVEASLGDNEPHVNGAFSAGGNEITVSDRVDVENNGEWRTRRRARPQAQPPVALTPRERLLGILNQGPQRWFAGDIFWSLQFLVLAAFGWRKTFSGNADSEQKLETAIQGCDRRKIAEGLVVYLRQRAKGAAHRAIFSLLLILLSLAGGFMLFFFADTVVREYNWTSDIDNSTLDFIYDSQEETRDKVAALHFSLAVLAQALGGDENAPVKYAIHNGHVVTVLSPAVKAAPPPNGVVQPELPPPPPNGLEGAPNESPQSVPADKTPDAQPQIDQSPTTDASTSVATKVVGMNQRIVPTQLGAESGTLVDSLRDQFESLTKAIDKDHEERLAFLSNISAQIETKSNDALRTAWMSYLPVITIRIGAVAMILFLVKILLPMYRYNILIGNFYNSRADALLVAGESRDQLTLPEIAAVLEPTVDYGKSPRTPADQAVGLAKYLVEKGIVTSGKSK